MYILSLLAAVRTDCLKNKLSLCGCSKSKIYLAELFIDCISEEQGCVLLMQSGFEMNGKALNL